MRSFQAIEYVLFLSAQHSGASIGRGLIERRVSLPDESLFFVWWMLVFLDWLFTAPVRFFDFVFDWLFIGWPDDLKLIGAACGLIWQEQATAI